MSLSVCWHWCRHCCLNWADSWRKILTAIIQSHRLILFGHIMRMDDNADAKRILLASPPTDWRRQLGRPRITWLSTVHRIWNNTTLCSPKQQIWLRTALCGGWCRRMVLRNRELHARNDDDSWQRKWCNRLRCHRLQMLLRSCLESFATCLEQTTSCSCHWQKWF